MRTILTNLSFLLPSLILQAHSPNIPFSSRPLIPVGDPTSGFTEAILDAATLQDLLRDADCTSIRFYNVKLDSANGAGTVMAIGIRSNGTEINEATGEPYRSSTGLSGSQSTVRNLSAESASQACGHLRTSGNTSYSAHFTRSAITELLALERCNGLKIVTSTANGNLSMSVTAVSISEGRAEVLGADPAFTRSCGDPCPTVCGPPENYISNR